MFTIFLYMTKMHTTVVSLLKFVGFQRKLSLPMHLVSLLTCVGLRKKLTIIWCNCWRLWGFVLSDLILFSLDFLLCHWCCFVCPGRVVCVFCNWYVILILSENDKLSAFVIYFVCWPALIYTFGLLFVYYDSVQGFNGLVLLLVYSYCELLRRSTKIYFKLWWENTTSILMSTFLDNVIVYYIEQRQYTIEW